jgi:hypothetical protein
MCVPAITAATATTTEAATTIDRLFPLRIAKAIAAFTATIRKPIP